MADAEKLEQERQRFLKSILSRGPHKRQIKPAEYSPLLQFALGEDEDDDSEEDEDFKVHEDYDSGSDDDYEEDNERPGPSFVSGEQLSEDSDSDSEMEVDAHRRPSATLTVGALIEAMKKKPLSKGHASSVASSEGPESSKKMDILICGVCLDDVSDEGDEIVECDNCGMTVHEGCYGINDEDNDSGKSSDTDSPTEAWFCDSCRAREKPPDCELCPNLGGIFKETDTGQWVHLLCALYTPGVAFVKPETLESVTLSELTPYRWGAKDCNLCEDERFSRTGVCVSCDAGMCKTYFHITCAHMHGLLSEVPEECDEDVADPLYAHCKLHADKKATASRRRAWMAYQSRYKKREERVSVQDKTRLKTLLQETRRLFQEQRKKDNVKPYTPTEKVPRLLSSCPGACRQLFKKAELLGYATKQNHSVVNVRRKWFVAPALTCEFVNYYHDRDHRLKEMEERQQELQANSKLLHEEEQKLRLQYDTLSDDMQGFPSSVSLFREENQRLHCILCDLGAQEFSIPEVLEVKKTKPIASDSPAEAMEIHQCFTCKKTDNQHQMADCDTCRNFYHLACVDPPLTRMPKKSAKCLWQCSECDSSEGEDEMDVDVSDNTPISQSRQRRTIKEPTKFTPDKLELSKKIRRKRKSGDGPSEPDSAKKKTKVEPKQSSKSRHKYVRVEKVIDKRSECSHCGKAGENTTLVRCDNCKLCYHFGCLDPPVKSNPKKRGYMWCCTDCDESEDDSEEEEEEGEREKAADTSLEGAGDTEKEQPVAVTGDDAGKEAVNEGKKKEEKGEESVNEEKKVVKVKGDDAGKGKAQEKKEEKKREESVSEEKKVVKVKEHNPGKEKVQEIKEETAEENVSNGTSKAVKDKSDVDIGKGGSKEEANTQDGKAVGGKKVKGEQKKKKVNEEEMGGGKAGTEGEDKEGSRKKGKNEKEEGGKKDEEQKNKKEKVKEQSKKKRKTDEQKKSAREEKHKKAASKLNDKEEGKTEAKGSSKETEAKTKPEKEKDGKKKEKSDKAKAKKKNDCEASSPKEIEKCEAEEKPKEKRDNTKRSKVGLW